MRRQRGICGKRRYPSTCCRLPNHEVRVPANYRQVLYPCVTNVSATGRQSTGWSSKRHVTPTSKTVSLYVCCIHRVSKVYEHPRREIQNWRWIVRLVHRLFERTSDASRAKYFLIGRANRKRRTPAAQVCLTGEWLYMCRDGEVVDKRAIGCTSRPTVCFVTDAIISTLRDNKSRLMRKRINVFLRYPRLPAFH